MREVTVRIPSVGLEGLFTFKEPFNTAIKNRNNINVSPIKLKVVSVITMKDMVRTDLRDPFTLIYEPATLTEVDYKKDLIDNIPIISLLYINEFDVESYIRVPLNYIESISSLTDIEYYNKLIILDMGWLPSSVDLTVFFDDMKVFVESRTGVNPDAKEVTVGVPETVDQDEHELKETIRNNTVTVYKTTQVQLEELKIKYDQLVGRLNELNIVLG